MPRILNLRMMQGASPFRKTLPENVVRVDRQSRWGNHFVMRNDSDEERNRVCDAFEEAVKSWAPEVIAAMKRELRGKDLACWCAPKRCHAETLLRIANED